MFCRLAPAADPSDNLLANPGFERPLNRGGWVYIPGAETQGILYQTFAWSHSGHFSLKLIPNQTNIVDWEPFDFGAMETISPTAYRGKTLYFGGWMKAEGGATAIIRMTISTASGGIIYRELTQSSSTPDYFRDLMDVPDEDLSSITLECSVRGTAGAAYFDDVVVSPSLAGTVQVGQYDPGPPLGAAISIDTTQVLRTIPDSLYGMNLEWVFNGHTLWDQYNQELNQRLLNLSSSIGVRLWRYPGGVFANHYHWLNGIGPQDSRPGTPIQPGGSLSANGFGTDEALTFANATGAGDMMFTVNANTGTPQEAADWVRYVNNGNRHVSYWEIGNELYLAVVDDNGNPVAWTPEQYSQTFLDFAAAMRAADPSIKLGADIEFHYPFRGCARMGDTGCWTDVILKNVGSQLDFVSVHNGFAPLGLAPLSGPDAGWDVRTVYSAMLAFPVLLTDLMNGLSEKIDELAGANAPNITIAATEWGPLFDIGPYSRLVDHVKTLGSALYVASAFNVLLRNPRVQQAVAFKLLDENVFGWMGLRQGLYVSKAPYYAFQLYAQHFQPQLVATTTQSPTYDSRTVLGVPAIKNVPYLDVIASTSTDGNTLSIIVTNRHFDRAVDTWINLGNFWASGTGTAWTLNGTALDANTGTDLTPGVAPQSFVVPDGRYNQGGQGEIWVDSTNFDATGSVLYYEFPPHSVTALVLTAGVPQGCGQGSPSGGVNCPSN